MLLLVNRPRLMGSFKNNKFQNFAACATAVVMIVLTGGLIYSSIAG